MLLLMPIQTIVNSGMKISFCGSGMICACRLFFSPGSCSRSPCLLGNPQAGAPSLIFANDTVRWTHTHVSGSGYVLCQRSVNGWFVTIWHWLTCPDNMFNDLTCWNWVAVCTLLFNVVFLQRFQFRINNASWIVQGILRSCVWNPGSSSSLNHAGLAHVAHGNLGLGLFHDDDCLTVWSDLMWHDMTWQWRVWSFDLGYWPLKFVFKPEARLFHTSLVKSRTEEPALEKKCLARTIRIRIFCVNLTAWHRTKTMFFWYIINTSLRFCYKCFVSILAPMSMTGQCQVKTIHCQVTVMSLSASVTSESPCHLLHHLYDVD